MLFPRAPRPSRPAILLAAAVASTLLPSSLSRAANKTWIGPNGGSWNTSANWSPNGVPSAATTDNVTVTPTPSSNYAITFNTNYPTTALGTITLDSLNAFSLTLNHTSSSFTLRAGTELIGPTGNATYNHSAGSNVVGSTLSLGSSAGATGTYSLSGTGSLSAPTAYVGDFGSGTFAQSGGTASVNSLNVAFQPGSSGTYQLSGGSLSSSGATIGGMGLSSTGTFIHSAGNYTVSSGLTLGFEGTGRYFLDGGALATGSLTLGLEGTGSLSQTGGACTSGDVVIGLIGQGYYSLQSGTLSAATITLGGDTLFNNGGDGHFSVSGGSATVAGALKVYDSSLNISSVDLSGGTLSVGSLDLAGNPSRFNWTGGTLRFANGYTINPSFALGDNFHLLPGRTLAAGAPSTIASALFFDGGTLAGTAALTNNGSLIGFGTLAQPLTNSPTGTVQLSAGHTLTLSSVTLSNAGAILLNSGTLAGTGLVSNTGVLSGPGAVTAPLSNTGTISVPDGPLSVPSFTNAGLITLDSAAAQLTGGPITNAATLQGRGRVTANLTNTGTTEPVNGVLQLAGTVSNPGTLRATTGNKLLVTGSFPTNTGTVLLAGGTLDTNNQPLSNTGSVTGYGLISTGTFTNAGSVLLSGGSTTVTGPVVNTAAHTFTVQNTPALFTAPVTNNGTFKILNTTATFAAGFSGNSPSAPGSLTLDPTAALLGNSLSNTAVTNSGAITLRPASQGGSASTLTALTLNPGATFDLADNPLFITAGGGLSASALRTYLLNHQLFSSTADSDPQHRLTLGYLQNSDTSLTIKTTYYGDANLDGTVNADDFALIDRGRAKSLTGWSNGDFNSDGTVTPADYLLIDRVFAQQSGPLSPDFLSQRESEFGPAYVAALLTSIPEPTLLTRRRRCPGPPSRTPLPLPKTLRIL